MSINSCYRGEHNYENIAQWDTYDASDKVRATAVAMWCLECGSVVIDLLKPDGTSEPGKVMDVRQPDLLVYSYERDKALNESLKASKKITGLI